MHTYFGRYVDFQTASKKDASVLLGADTMVGEILSIERELEDGVHRAWLINNLGARIGYLDPKISRELSLQMAKGLDINAVLSFVAFTDHPDEGHYWGQVALIGYEPAQKDVFDPFLHSVATRMAQGLRTQVDLGPDAVSHIVESEGAWLPQQTLPLPEKTKGTAIIKYRQGLNDRLITQGRSGNKGCYVASWVFLLAAVALALFSLKSCFFS